MARKRTTTLFRELLARPGIVRSVGAHDCFTARILEREGFETVFIGGFGTSASRLGMPDLNLLTMTEMAEAVRRMAACVSIPVVADGDTGHGGIANVVRTVREFESAGAAGILLEDQVAPKRCGHFAGKEVIPAEEMVLKLKAALQARSDPDFVIIARTDAREPRGLDDAIARANLYGDAGADCVFIEAPRSVEELEAIPRRVAHPLLVNMLTGGATPALPVPELERMGYRIAVFPIESLLVTLHAVRDLARALLRDGSVEAVGDRMASFDEVKDLLGLQEYLSLGDTLSRR